MLSIADVPELVQATTTGPVQVEGLAWQHWPIFLVVESAISFGLWLAFSLQAGGWSSLSNEPAGLDSLWPGQSDMVIHRDCHDMRLDTWRWLTYQFTHASLQHVCMNIILNLIVGIPLEGFHGHFRVSIIFNIGVALAALCQAVVFPHVHSLVGMSGGCYALMGMHVSDLLMNWKQMAFRYPKLGVLAMLVFLDFLTMHLSKDSDGSKVSTSHSAHLGGYLAGMLLGVLLGRNLRVKRCERVIQAVVALLVVGMLAFSTVTLAEWPPRSLWDTHSWCWVRQVFEPDLFGHEWHCIFCSDQACINKWSQQSETMAVDSRLCAPSARTFA